MRTRRTPAIRAGTIQNRSLDGPGPGAGGGVSDGQVESLQPNKDRREDKLCPGTFEPQHAGVHLILKAVVVLVLHRPPKADLPSDCRRNRGAPPQLPLRLQKPSNGFLSVRVRTIGLLPELTVHSAIWKHLLHISSPFCSKPFLWRGALPSSLPQTNLT